MKVTQQSSTKLSDCESECESELPDGRADTLPSEYVPLLNWVSTGVVSERADLQPFTCVAVELRSVRRSELIGRTSLSYRRRGWLCLVAASSCCTPGRCRSDAVVCRWSCRPFLSPRRHPFDAVGWAIIAPWSRFPDTVSRSVIAVGVRSWFDGVSLRTSSPSPESRISYFFIFNSFSSFWAVLLPDVTIFSKNLLWICWLFTELL